METMSLFAENILRIGESLSPYIQRLRAERRASGDSGRVNASLLDGLLEETLNRLQDIEAHDSKKRSTTWVGDIRPSDRNL